LKKQLNKNFIITLGILGILLIVVAPFAFKAVISERNSPKVTKDEEVKRTIDEARVLAGNIDAEDKQWKLYSLYNEEVKLEQKKIYNEAVKATNAALNTQMQDSINYARKLNASLSDGYADKKVAMSMKLDLVQQELINRAFRAMDSAKLTKNQSDIDVAREMALSLPEEFHVHFLPTLDELQQEYKNKAMEALSLAEKSGKKKDYNKAYELYLDLVRVKHNNEVNMWALSELKPRLDKIKIRD